ncbi:MAG: YraN family protein [candidate division Zixibacteria bacterium]|nr:YraN family protein [candidate division Zixibacteria bacterium]
MTRRSQESTRASGTHGEDLTEQFLIQKGYTTLTRNYRDKVSRCEIDLIVRQDRRIVFVEVKSCTQTEFGAPETWVIPRKQIRIARAAQGYLYEQGLHDAECRFDVVGVLLGQNPPQFMHIEQAFWSVF